MKAVYVASGQESQTRRLARKKLTTLMSSPVLSISGRTLLGDALATMVRAGRRHLAVVDDDGRCIGVLGDRVVAAAWAMDPDALDRLYAVSALDAGPALLDERASVVDAGRLMRTVGVDAVVVIDVTGAPIGIVTGSDLVAQLA